MDKKSVIVEMDAQIATIWLNKENRRNAFDEEMINRLIAILTVLEDDPAIRIVILRGKGKVFCAGADLNWMQKAIDYSYDENLKESVQLSKMLYQLYAISKPTIAVVQGAAFGGGIGLLSACDFVLAVKDTKFSFSEVTMGLIPATISPFAMKRMGETKSKHLMLTGKVFDPVEAQHAGLVDFYGGKKEVEQKTDEISRSLLATTPEALSKTKRLINEVVNNWSLETAIEKTAQIIAEIRSTDEAQQGMRSFLKNKVTRKSTDG